MNVNDLKYNEQGLIPCITQDCTDGTILMLAYMNKESLERTIKEKVACYFSRSRNKFWLKGEESGNVQKVKEILIDCDKDTILLKVEQVGNCACHNGYRSCFYRKWDGNDWKVVDEKVKDPDQMYNNLK